ncbi:SIMPL domain-containing protein [Sphingomonas jatrophae]|uniref:26 kDa periplasmic immunogenic protein n=1 Tax=Sphingomonas jatrophae TaxID=1166337 RepID=A0A1I6KZ56_9SPHN|nr:SIMPL domain-containing protein [Sphingomonas jatrophae]SFR96278.1 hypothetical protein SAMN05192580_1966 [Sphingomonas jatrophae]
MKRLFALALAAAPLALQAQVPVAPQPAAVTGTLLAITADGEVVRTPDLAVIGAGVVTQAATAEAAMRDNATRMAATFAALRRAGIAERDVQTAGIGLQPQYRYAENQPPAITGYQATNRVTVRFRDVKKAGSVLDALVAAGANQIDGPNLTVDRLDEALDEARAQAVAKARARAELYAKASGLRVGRIVTISEESGGPNMPMPMVRMSAAKMEADTAIAPGEQRLTVTLRLTFELQ